MTEQDIDILWQQAMYEAIEHNEPYTRYRFAKKIIELCSSMAETHVPAHSGDWSTRATARAIAEKIDNLFTIGDTK